MQYLDRWGQSSGVSLLSGALILEPQSAEQPPKSLFSELGIIYRYRRAGTAYERLKIRNYQIILEM